jgi:serine/threonine protein kinase
MSAATPYALRSGTQVLDYSVENILGSGGFGITYRAFDRRLDRTVALKEYFPAALAMRIDGATVATRPDSMDGAYAWGLEKFLHEAMSLAKLQHSNIVGVSKLFRANGTAYMAIDYVDGPNFKDWLRELGRRPTQDELDRLMFPLLAALHEVHGYGLLHRDIAPKNIMIARPLVPVLIDFGAARQMVGQRSQTFAALLTPGYAPFEQYVANGQNQGAWTDIYSLAATFYEAISGRLPPEAPDRALEDHCVPAATIGQGHYRPEFLAAIDWGLRPLPQDRPQSVAEWSQALAHTGAASGPYANGDSRAVAKGWKWTGGWFGRG